MNGERLELTVMEDEYGTVLKLGEETLRFVENYRITKSSELKGYSELELKMLVDLVIQNNAREQNV